MATIHPIQMLLVGFTLLLAFPLATSTTTSKEEIKCDECTPVLYPSPPPPVYPSPPPPVVIECPPPPVPPSPPPPPKPITPPPACPNCPPCPSCPPICIVCPPVCPGCPPPPCNVCQVPAPPSYPSPAPPRQPRDEPGVMGGAVYSPPNGVNPYFPYTFNTPPSRSSANSNLELKQFLVSIIFLLATFSFF
ncbi:hypothetical protein CCACVL1_22174 [Corchorus capsularis]|uniref:Leucine-rich repeat extensin-like protein 3 n=1 Tax=Corchorus capsularis TaxID=210143 RepID=A0A1R3H0P3_COCAP|nr:hypothetical protein CCACVL1_22174 [Corchorus capsularis]